MLCKIKKEKEYVTSYDFCVKESNLKELYNIFDDLEEIKKSKTSKEDKILAINEFLNSYGWSDEEIIKEILKRRAGKYLVSYVPEHNGYFIVYELR